MKTSEQIEEGLYQLDKTKEIKSNHKTKTTYTLFGQHHKLKDGYPILINVDADKTPEVYAIAETNDVKVVYFIKTDDAGTLFNPIEISPSQTHKKFKLLGDSKLWQFTKVSEECFNCYKEFLKTRNTLHLKFAEQKRVQ